LVLENCVADRLIDRNTSTDDMIRSGYYSVTDN